MSKQNTDSPNFHRDYNKSISLILACSHICPIVHSDSSLAAILFDQKRANAIFFNKENYEEEGREDRIGANAPDLRNEREREEEEEARERERKRGREERSEEKKRRREEEKREEKRGKRRCGAIACAGCVPLLRLIILYLIHLLQYRKSPKSSLLYRLVNLCIPGQS